MDRTLTLTELADRPELEIEIGGLAYRFGEVYLGGHADLQEYLRRAVPHPVQAIRPHLDGLKPEDRQALLENARQEARDWPPKVGTSRGNAALLATEEGQVLALEVGLKKFHPDLGKADAAHLYRELSRDTIRRARRARKHGGQDDGEGLVTRIFSVITGMGDPAAQADEPLPEG